MSFLFGVGEEYFGSPAGGRISRISTNGVRHLLLVTEQNLLLLIKITLMGMNSKMQTSKIRFGDKADAPCLVSITL